MTSPCIYNATAYRYRCYSRTPGFSCYVLVLYATTYEGDGGFGTPQFNE